MTYINKGGAVKVIHSTFHIILEHWGDAFKTARPKQNRRWGWSQRALQTPVCCLSPRHLWATYPGDTLCVCSSLAVPVMSNRLSSRGYQLSSSSRVCMLMCHYKILFAGMHSGNAVGQNEWELMLLAALEWAHREGWLILSFYTIHLQSTWLSAFFSTGNLWLPCWISSKPVCYDYKTLPGPPGSQRGGH